MKWATRAALRRFDRFSHYWCPNCGAPEAMHPEACLIAPDEWSALYRYAFPIGIALASRHGRVTVR